MNSIIRILIAECNIDFLNMIENTLRIESDRYIIEKVDSGVECMKRLNEKRFDLLIMGNLLIDGNGLDWLRRFNAMGISIPTIFITEKGDSKLALEAMKEGVFDYINRSAECAKAIPFVVNRAIEGYHLMLEKVRLQKELIEAKNFLESIVENEGDAISVVDLEGKVIYWNKGAERIYGFKKEEVLGKNPSQFIYPEDERVKMEEERLMNQLISKLLNGDVISNHEARRRTKDGREIIISMTISPLRNAHGEIIGFSKICKDITEIKKTEERLILTERLSSLGELTAGVAHELRNPLAGIKINTQILLRNKDLSETEKKLLKSTEEGIEKIQKIVDDMLNFAKPRPTHFKNVDINELIERSLEILQTKLKKANISTFFEKGMKIPELKVDPHQIQQVFINLILNSIQAMQNGGTLTLRTFLEKDGKVGVEIRDTGIGIPRENLKKIFDPFFTTKSEGTGLGLSISLKILENHEATIDVMSKEGEGSTFIIHFPAQRTLKSIGEEGK